LVLLITGPVILNPVTGELSPDAPYEPAPESLMDAIERWDLLLLLLYIYYTTNWV